ncbi:hypothetical protein M0R45_008678 [Rubus argutus]|uniref:Uncharacterized protein n=1 Tax=Rubus argutus TaxID=59490 RepID=A0AAW1Y213_RUBAR
MPSPTSIGIGPPSLIFPAKRSHFPRARPRMATCGAVDNGNRSSCGLSFQLYSWKHNHMPLPGASSSGSDRDAPKPLDIVSNEIIFHL